MLASIFPPCPETRYVRRVARFRDLSLVALGEEVEGEWSAWRLRPERAR